ncbi:ribosome silencing factor [Marinigracilibium pacificum]|uniref:Ribosomal silencing factor RsfS n=1 Tax=Marinigracilibium pacificum TaxID=2729599 RepID=A0A848J0X7_9BACT|nr:ribosome silencing factor [Marinigracilibium pacificum]NMM49466.1 ribosome silencing factor [Marinigracilibium pacificum]
MNSSELAALVVEGMQDKKAKDIVLLDLREVKNSISDYFVICTGGSDTQIEAIADSIEKKVFEQASENPFNKEGTQNRQWVIIDFVDVVAHVFSQKDREHYNLENLWGDADIKTYENIV